MLPLYEILLRQVIVAFLLTHSRPKALRMGFFNWFLARVFGKNLDATEGKGAKLNITGKTKVKSFKIY
jgi:hypothetical protein